NWQREKEGRDDADAPEVAGGRSGHVRPHQPAPDSRSVANVFFEERPTVRDQVVAGIPLPLSWESETLRLADCSGRPIEHAPGDLQLGEARATGQVLDRMAVAVTAREVHGLKVAAAPKRRVDRAEALEECGSLERR